MIRLVCNNDEFELNCRSFTYGYGRTPGVRNGWITSPPDYCLTVEFEGNEPEILRKIALRGKIIDIISIYPNEFIPLGLNFLYVIVDSIDHRLKLGEKAITKVYMKALRIETTGESVFGKIKEKFCITCGRDIHFTYVIAGMSEWFPQEKVVKLWNNDLIEFYCCQCYKKQEEK